jgi:hypothetical protein
MINYGQSAPKEAADKLCSSRAGDDRQKRAECMDKERDRFTADVLVFGKKDKQAYWTIYRRARNALTELSKAQIRFDKDRDGCGRESDEREGSATDLHRQEGVHRFRAEREHPRAQRPAVRQAGLRREDRNRRQAGGVRRPPSRVA